MATKTTNYNLTKPDGSENADIDVINANMDTIDSALSNKADKSQIPDVSGYLPKSGGTMAGTLNLVENGSPSALWRHGLEGYRSGVAYKTNGNEAVCFENENPVTSWIFRYYNSVSLSGTQWNDVTPSMQIKNQRVVINKLIGNDTDAEYNLDVGGTANATTLYQGGKQVANKEDIPDVSGYLPKSGGTMTGNLAIEMPSYPNLTMKNQNWGGQFAITEADDGTALFQNNKTVNGADTYSALYLKPASNGLNNALSIGMDDGTGWKGATVLHSQNYADHISIPDVSGKANLNSSNVFEGDQSLLGKTLLKYGGSDTPLTVQTTASSTGCYIELKNSEGATLGYYGALSSRRPVFYVNSNRELAFLDEVPKITASTTDIGEGSSLATGTLYLVYE